MRILALATWWPEPANNGSRMRIMHLLQALARVHEVHLVAFTQGPPGVVQRNTIDRLCASVRLTPQRDWQPTRFERVAAMLQRDPAYYSAIWDDTFASMVRERAMAVRPDAVIAFQINVAPYTRLVPGVPRILDEVELAYLLEQFTRQRTSTGRLRYGLSWAKHRSYVQRLLAGFDACTVVSDQEERLVRRLAPLDMPVTVTPNGADVAGCETISAAPKPDTLIYPGALSFDANFDAMDYFLAEIMPLVRSQQPSVRLRITGQASAERKAALPSGAGVEFTGFVPDVRPLIAESWAEVVPLRKGGGTRLKILEALALGTPVVTTSKGVEGLELRHGEHLLVADGSDRFAAATLLLMSQPALRAYLARAGRRAVQERYDWRVIGGRFCQLVDRIAKERTNAEHSYRCVGHPG